MKNDIATSALPYSILDGEIWRLCARLFYAAISKQSSLIMTISSPLMTYMIVSSFQGLGGGQPVRELGLEAMGELKGKLLSQPLVVGICLGMQVLCGWLEEAATNGFGIVNTPIRKISLKSNISKANIGYRTIATDDGPMRFYFCHSFAAERVETLNEVDTCFTFEEPCFEKYIAGFRAGKIYGLQFHPEKSGPAGREFFIRIMNV